MFCTRKRVARSPENVLKDSPRSVSALARLAITFLAIDRNSFPLSLRFVLISHSSLCSYLFLSLSPLLSLSLFLCLNALCTQISPCAYISLFDLSAILSLSLSGSLTASLCASTASSLFPERHLRVFPRVDDYMALP